MAPPILPWAVLPNCHVDSLNTLVQLYEPYTESVLLKSQPARLTILGYEQPQAYGPGLYTSLHDVRGENTLCNFLQLSLANSPEPTSLYAKRSFSVNPELTTKFFHQLCLEFSDVICIRARTVDEAAHSVLRFRESIESDRAQTELQWIILLETNSPRTKVDETDVKKYLDALIEKEGSSSQWTSRVFQHLIVRSYDPKRTNLSELLAAIQGCTTAMRKMRSERRHLWTLGEINYLLEQYLTAKLPFVACHQNPPRIATLLPGATWYPMAFRRRFWPGKDIQEQNGLAKWLRATDQDIDLNVSLAPIFARMFLEDGDLLPHELFASIYGPLCSEAWCYASRDCGWIARKGLTSFLDAVVSRMRPQNPDLWRDAQIGLRKVRGESLCCMCPWDMQPWLLFPCGHGICERDAWHYSGIQPDDAEYPTLAHFSACPACGAPVDLKVRLRPLQAGYRVASFDGGGVLGIVSLIALQSIAEGLPKALSAHHYFDLIVGTSTGSIISAALGLMQWPLSYCIEVFCSTANDIFGKKSGMIALVRRLLRLHRVGAQYDINVFCNILKDVFGEGLMREGIIEAKQDVVRVAITSTTFDSRLCLFRSYGDVLREAESGDHIPQQLFELPLWQACVFHYLGHFGHT
ncbi:hypothetical protein N7471_010377 [Penicillium samsonianum]|uniref:uncharacterized protein n=1 Tax=Penicillium samsonianum TaxID=1882272 RepID=UPI002548E878|nr:uncharacterized protein N7471_010377 [Penicillium samsonianum]KAJ6125884.1 hypothetical protein N7471_010377 [Penicillium samsonianum]